MQENQFKFTGTGGEYFKIWIVNLLLTIVTLGIYSAWAKVRRNQYFYRNTWLADASFDYHGDPKAILKGRLVAFALFATYQFSVSKMVSPGAVINTTAAVIAGITFLVIVLAMPFLIQRSIAFKLRNSSYRGLRFKFTGTVKDAYKYFLGVIMVVPMTLYLLAPFAHQRIKRYQHNNAFLGNAAFSFDADVGKFNKVYGITFLLFLLLVTAVSALTFGVIAALGNGLVVAIVIIAAIYLSFIFAFVLIGPYFSARIHNLVWNNTQLEKMPFESRIKARQLLLIYVTNVIAIIFTLGLFKPFATIRLLKYKLENMALIADSAQLNQFVADQSQNVSAVGDGAADFFDFDLAL